MKTKKLIVFGLIFVAVLMISIFTNSVFADSLGNLTITQERKVGDVTYKHQLYSNNPSNTKNIWKLVTCQPDRTIIDDIDDIYCLRAGLGFTSASPSNYVIEYSQSYSMIDDYESIVEYFRGVTSETTIFNDDTENTKRFYAVMWILDHMLLEGASDTQVTQYLKDYAGYTDGTLNASPLEENVLTRADIEAIQQLAIWYFTNADEVAYHNDTLPTIYMTIDGDGIYDTATFMSYSDIFNTIESYGTQRQTRANSLYQTLISQALAAVTDGANVIPYTPSREITVYLAGTGAALEQPVVRVEEKEVADVVLRKFISSVAGTDLTVINSRVPEVDTSNLNKSGQTTAVYNHTKTPLKVSLGDIVIYTLRIYNEGDTDVYIKEVTDYLPEYLEATTNSEWTVANRKAVSKSTCKVVGASSNLTSEIGNNLGDVLLPKAVYNDGTDNYTLSYVDVQISCTVKNTTPYNTNITNIAQITKVTNSKGRILDQEGDDRDSIANGNFTLPTDANLPTYTGGDNGGSNLYYDGTNKVNPNYYPGQEDDDDFEKVYVEAPEIDLALRKYISAVNGTKLTGNALRAPVADTSNLNVNNQTTAIYNHTKDALKVSIGDTVTYTLRIYNEGSTDAYVKEIKDYLPEYLEYTPYGDDAGSWWLLDNATGRIATVTEYCIVKNVGGNIANTEIGKALGNVLIPAAEYNSSTHDYTLSYVDVEISCNVMMTVPYDTNITNVAQITKMADENNIVRDRDRDSTANGRFTLPTDEKLPTYTGGDNGGSNLYYDGTNKVNPNYYPGQEDDDDFEKVYVETPVVDLALRKFISKVGDTPYNRAPVVDTTPLKQGEDTAIYNHSKVPVQVEVGDVVTYTIRIYNEGDVDARVSSIKDHIAKNLKYVPFGLDTEADWWTEIQGENNNTLISTDKLFVMNVGGNTDISYQGVDLEYVVIPAYDNVNDVLSYVDVEVHCQVLPVSETTKLTNIAEITGMTDEYGNPLEEDRDSEPDNVDLPDDFPGYKDDKIEEGLPYIPGQEDDDDFEKVIVVVPEVDLSLRKFITKVGDTSYDRAPVVNTSPLDNHTGTTAIYNHTKTPITVVKGGLVTYTIRVYNEGEVDVFVSEITDYLPNYLTYVADNETNLKYGWSYDNTTRKVTTTITAEDNQAGNTVYANRQNGKLLLKYSGNQELNYIDVEIVCKVNEIAPGNKVLTNLAQITEIKDTDGNEIEQDRDSTPDGNFVLPGDSNRPSYTGGDNGGSNLYYDGTNKVDTSYYPGQEDDDDFEKVLVKPDFDLALRKFITKVGVTNINNRYPEVTYVDGKLVYTHTKVPVEVVTGDVVTYTIRVFNEGEADGYANEITDDVPEGLEFLPENETNVEYRWKMLDENQEETTDVSKAKYIITDYLSEEQEVATGRTNIIKAFNKDAEVTDTNPDFKDVKIAFKVTYKATTKEESARIITNTAQISADSDDDIDSEPKRDEVYNHDGDNEDDIDFDRVKVKYFDLSLLKWVAQTEVTLNGETITTDTGHTAETSHNEAPVKIEIKESEINKISIKYIYTIRITNEGEIEGYATEITDYIPEGLKFVQEDNPDWYEISDGVVGTKALENTLLKPGDTADVKIVLTWINGAENFGEKVNLAEISKDKNESDSPDVDSTPNNKVPDEDDIDDAPVVLAVKTGSIQIYVGLTLIILVTFAGGTGLIKKYVLE